MGAKMRRMNTHTHGRPALSVLDLVPVSEGTAPSDAIRRVGDLARLAEKLDYARIWYAEHHALPSVACSAPELLIGHAASVTQRIRVGSGGIMLPNHASLRVAENFHTLRALYPDRIDLGVGRAPGGVPNVPRALRAAPGEMFGQQLAELYAYSAPDWSQVMDPSSEVHAVPADAGLPPIWLLGSSGASARMAGAAGLGYAFATHFSPTPAAPAMRTYRDSFQPSDEHFAAPHAILCVAVICAPTDEEARYLAGSMELAWVRMQSNQFPPLPSPETAAAYQYGYESEALERFRKLAVIGSPATVRERLLELARDNQADELMLITNVWDHALRLRSYELVAEAMSA